MNHKMIVTLTVFFTFFCLLTHFSCYADDALPSTPPPLPATNNASCVSGPLSYESIPSCIDKHEATQKGYTVSDNKIVLAPPPPHIVSIPIIHCEALCVYAYNVCRRVENGKCGWSPVISQETVDTCRHDCASMTPVLLKAIMRAGCG
jgi:hypothetical protein